MIYNSDYTQSSSYLPSRWNKYSALPVYHKGYTPWPCIDDLENLVLSKVFLSLANDYLHGY
jgi:hypothetical protein